MIKLIFVFLLIFFIYTKVSYANITIPQEQIDALEERALGIQDAIRDKENEYIDLYSKITQKSAEDDLILTDKITKTNELISKRKELNLANVKNVVQRSSDDNTEVLTKYKAQKQKELDDYYDSLKKKVISENSTVGNNYNSQLEQKKSEIDTLKINKNNELKTGYNNMKSDVLTSILPEIPYQTYLPEEGFCSYDGSEKIHQDVPGCGRICSYASGFQEKEVKDENNSSKIKDKSWGDSSSCWYGYTPLIWESVEGRNDRKIRDIYKDSVPLPESNRHIPYHWNNGLKQITGTQWCRNGLNKWPKTVMQIVPGCGVVCSSKTHVGIKNVYTKDGIVKDITPWNSWTTNATKYRCDKAQLEKVWKWKNDSEKELVMSDWAPRGLHHSNSPCNQSELNKFNQCKIDAQGETQQAQDIRLYLNDDCNKALAACAF